jgi:hypothetical protein
MMDPDRNTEKAKLNSAAPEFRLRQQQRSPDRRVSQWERGLSHNINGFRRCMFRPWSAWEPDLRWLPGREADFSLFTVD